MGHITITCTKGEESIARLAISSFVFTFHQESNKMESTLLSARNLIYVIITVQKNDNHGHIIMPIQFGWVMHCFTMKDGAFFG